MRLVTKLVVDKATDDRILSLTANIVSTVGNKTLRDQHPTDYAKCILRTKQALLTEVRRLIQQAYKMGAEQ